MDRKSAARLFKTSYQLVNWRGFVWFAAIAILFPTVLTHLFFWRIEHRLNLKVHRKPFFTLLPGLIILDDVSLEWAGRLYVRSGSLKVQFPVTSILLNRFSLTLNGRNLAIQAGQELNQALGKNEIIFDRVSAKILIDSKRGIDIEFLDAESKTIQFHLSGSPKSS